MRKQAKPSSTGEQRKQSRSWSDESTSSSSSSETGVGEFDENDEMMPRAKKEKTTPDEHPSRQQQQQKQYQQQPQPQPQPQQQRHVCMREWKPKDRLGNKDWLWRYAHGDPTDCNGTRLWCCGPCHRRNETGRVGKEHVLLDTEIGRRRAAEHLRRAHNIRPEQFRQRDVQSLYFGWAYEKPGSSDTSITIYGLE